MGSRTILFGVRFFCQDRGLRALQPQVTSSCEICVIFFRGTSAPRAAQSLQRDMRWAPQAHPKHAQLPPGTNEWDKAAGAGSQRGRHGHHGGSPVLGEKELCDIAGRTLVQRGCPQMTDPGERVTATSTTLREMGFSFFLSHKKIPRHRVRDESSQQWSGHKQTPQSHMLPDFIF